MANPDKKKSDTAVSDNEEILTANGENFNDSAESEHSPSLEAKLEEKSRLLDEALDRYKRLQADFDNFRRRTVKEKEEISIIVTERIIFELLPVMDNFERAITSFPENDAGLTTGVEMIFRQFNAVFAKLGVEQIQAIECHFDPSQHEAVMRVEDSGKPEGTIVCEIQKGYKLNGRVLRASMVNVAG